MHTVRVGEGEDNIAFDDRETLPSYSRFRAYPCRGHVKNCPNNLPRI